VEQIANAALISFRTGCFCNPGIDELNHGVSAEELRNYFRNRDQGDYDDFILFAGKMRGAIRISIGIPTTRQDIEKFIAFAEMFLNKAMPESVLPEWERSRVVSSQL
jgi:selenocysteine lyase/cysteine desulfurase